MPVPPPLVSVLATRLVQNKRHLVTQILVTFSGAVEANGARQMGAYRLVTAGKRGFFTANNSRVIKLRTAAYDTASHTVVLTPRKAFGIKKPVQISINGNAPSGLKDSLGLLIDGDHNGEAGGSAVAVLTKNSVTQIARARTSGAESK